MGYKVFQNSFLGGIVSPALLSRVDLPDYQQGAMEITNFLINPQGSITSRGGFRYVAPVKEHGHKVRLIPFRFSSSQTLVLVFGHFWMRIVTEGKVLLSGGKPYEISTPYSEEDIFNLEYTQNADIITLTNPNHSPKELRRYGATDWRLVDCAFAPSIQPPGSVSGVAVYPDETKTYEKGTIKAVYKVTAVDAENRESTASKPFTIDCNYYITGGRVELTWSTVPGAKYYRVYREVAGIFGFLGQTDKTDIIDEGDNPDTTYTPPMYEVIFESKGGIKEVQVINGGSGYVGETTNVEVSGSASFPFPWGAIAHGLISPRYRDPPDPKVEIVFGLKAKPTDVNPVCKSDPIELIPVYKSFHEYGSPKNRYYWMMIFAPAIGDQGSLKVQFRNIPNTLTNPRIVLDSITSNVENHRAMGLKSYWSPNCFLDWYLDPGYVQGQLSWKPPANSSDPTPNDRYEYVSTPNWHKELAQKSQYANLRRRFPALFESMAPDCLRKCQIAEGCEIKEWIEGANSSMKLETKSDVELIVEDATGSGAKLAAVVEEGQIKSVSVISPGSNYTAPTIRVKASKGSGAVLKAILYDEDDYDYPSANTQYDQRRVFAGTLKNPTRILMTNAGQQDLMMYHLPTMADDRISLEAVTSDADRIIHAVALDSLLLFSRSAELRVFTQNSDSLSPDSVAVRVQSYVGANQVQPVVCNANVLYAASRGGHLRVLNYAYSAQGYESADLSLICPHLFDNKEIVDIALSKSPIQIAWVITNDGKLKVLTYYPEQSIKAWSVFETDGEFESCCSVPEGKEDHLYVVVKREVNGKEVRYIERLEYINIPNNDDCRQLDSFIDNTNVLMSENKSGEMTLTGLEHLEGKMVVAFADGVPHKPVQVVNGSIKIAQNGAKKIAVGIPYKSRLVTVPLATTEAQASMQGSFKNPSAVFLRTRFDGDVFAGSYNSENSESELWEIDREDLSNKKGLLKVAVSSSWEFNGQLEIVHKNALPLEITGIVGEYSYEGYKK